MIKINKLANFNEKLNLLRVAKKLPNPYACRQVMVLNNPIKEKATGY